MRAVLGDRAVWHARAPGDPDELLTAFDRGVLSDQMVVWLDDGTDDVWLPNIEATRAAIAQRGLNLTWHNFPGPHEAEYWIEHVPDYLRFYSSALRT